MKPTAHFRNLAETYLQGGNAVRANTYVRTATQALTRAAGTLDYGSDTLPNQATMFALFDAITAINGALLEFGDILSLKDHLRSWLISNKSDDQDGSSLAIGVLSDLLQQALQEYENQSECEEAEYSPSQLDPSDDELFDKIERQAERFDRLERLALGDHDSEVGPDPEESVK
jgi:hypothetical protein